MQVFGLKKRSEFTRVHKSGRSFVTPAFILLYLPEVTEDIRIGYTTSKKVGHSPNRSRARRRMRVLTDKFIRLNPDHKYGKGDYVLIARTAILSIEFDELCKFAERALRVVNKDDYKSMDQIRKEKAKS